MYPETFLADYSRLEQTPFNRTRLRQFHAMVIGGGALGNEVARVLGLLGAGRVTLVDPDTVEPSNLPRSVFFCGRNAVGQNKAYALAEAAVALFPDTEWTAIGNEIADVGFQKLVNAGLLFSCVDSDLARLELAYIAGKLRVPMVDGGLGRQNYSHGRVTYFPGTTDQACYACMLSPRKRRELLEWWQATLRPCGPGIAVEEADLVSTPTMASIIGSIQVEFGLRNLFEAQHGVPTPARSLEVDIYPSRQMTDFRIPVSLECPFHDSEESLHALPREDSTFEELLDSTSSDALTLDWPICTEAKCLACGKGWSPRLRLAALRRNGRCPSCQSRQILEQEIIRSIRRGSTWLQQTPAALQLPAEHLYSVQRHGSDR